MNLQPLADRIIMQQLAAEETTKSGIVLPGSAQKKPKKAEVLAVGKEVKEVSVGDHVFYNYEAVEIEDADQQYLVLKEEDVLALVKGGK